MTEQQLTEALDSIERYYAAQGRHDLPWRAPESGGTFDPYKIMVSELMLQQTQVARVIPKYDAFLAQFPDVQHLAASSLGDVLVAWQGLGYNRRAKFLWQAAQQIVGQSGDFPRTIDELVKLPGVGVNTAAAIANYAYNDAIPFIETNVRTVMIYHFFVDQDAVHDSEVHATAAALLERTALSPREWHWALMDYGTHLKQTVGNLNKLSKSYAKQSRFEGSRRQVRGAVLRQLAVGPQTLDMLSNEIADPRLPSVLADLEREGLVHYDAARYSLHHGK